MKNIDYQITFFSPWHCGSGLSAGADVDALVIKDRQNFPYVPGKTIKGLIREAAEDYVNFCHLNQRDLIIKSFGYSADASKDEKIHSIQGTMFFTNAVLSEQEQQIIKNQKAQNYLYGSISSTSIDDSGVAEKHSLRKIQTTVPCKLYGQILDVPDEFEDTLCQSFGLIKRLGVNRNRGLGRCKINCCKEGEQE
jgi:CRISPR/Cas system CSM-associated protein Csm3 (group 7 of RAMP superfamily)